MLKVIDSQKIDNRIVKKGKVRCVIAHPDNPEEVCDEWRESAGKKGYAVVSGGCKETVIYCDDGTVVRNACWWRITEKQNG